MILMLHEEVWSVITDYGNHHLYSNKLYWWYNVYASREMTSHMWEKTVFLSLNIIPLSNFLLYTPFLTGAALLGITSLIHF